MFNQLLSERDLARMLQVALVTVRRWRRNKIGPPHIRCGRRVIRYRVEAVNRWLLEHNGKKYNLTRREASA